MYSKLSGICLIFLLPLFAAAQQPAIDGNWAGAINIQGQNLAISVTFSSSNGETDGVLDIPQQNAFNLPVDVPYLSADSVHFEFQTGTGIASFHATLDRTGTGKMEGVFRQSGMEFPFSLEKADDETETGRLTLNQQEITIELDGHQLTGNLVIPENPADSVLVILASGSGSQDRNSLVAGFEIFKTLAAELADAGYHSFRFDDRGVGESTGEPDATLEELGDDLAGIADYFRNNMEQFSSIYIIGHSQGGITGAIAATRGEVDGLILMAAPALRGDEIITGQIRKISAEQGIPEEVVEQNLRFQENLYEAVRTGTGWEELEQDLEKRLREQIDELPVQQREALGDMDDFIASQIARQLSGSKTRWFKSFLETDPLELYGRLDIPMLAVFGEKDIQVIAGPNREALKRLDDQQIEIKTIPEANHLFQKANTGMPGEYGVLDKQFAEGFVQSIIEWVTKAQGSGSRGQGDDY